MPALLGTNMTQNGKVYLEQMTLYSALCLLDYVLKCPSLCEFARFLCLFHSLYTILSPTLRPELACAALLNDTTFRQPTAVFEHWKLDGQISRIALVIVCLAQNGLLHDRRLCLHQTMNVVAKVSSKVVLRVSQVQLFNT